MPFTASNAKCQHRVPPLWRPRDAVEVTITAKEGGRNSPLDRSDLSVRNATGTYSFKCMVVTVSSSHHRLALESYCFNARTFVSNALPESYLFLKLLAKVLRQSYAMA